MAASNNKAYNNKKKVVRFTLIVLLLVTPFDIRMGLPAITPYIPPKPKPAFLIAYHHIRKWEGGYSNHPKDRGGETYAGVTRRYHKDWFGWRYISDTLKRFDTNPYADFYAMAYYLDLWHNEGFYRLKCPDVASYLFDTRINISRRKTIQMLNLLPGVCVEYRKDWITPDLDSINLIELRDHRIRYYHELVYKRPGQRVFLKGWIKRANDV